MRYTKHMKLQNTVFVVTGGASGIGAELVRGLLARGAAVAAVDMSKENLDKLATELGASADALSTHQLDITDKKAVAGLPNAVIKAHGKIDGLINCAGIIQPFVRVADLDEATIDRVMNVNFFGTLHMTRAFLPHMLKHNESYLANVSSMGGFLPVPGQSVYGASKAAVKLLTEGLYAELLDTPVHVSVIFPGSTNTNITKNSGVTVPNAANIDTKKLQSSTLAADKAAEIILNGIEKNKPQIFTGKDSRFMNRLYRLNPVYATKFIAKQMKSLLG